MAPAVSPVVDANLADGAAPDFSGDLALGTQREDQEWRVVKAEKDDPNRIRPENVEFVYVGSEGNVPAIETDPTLLGTVRERRVAARITHQTTPNSETPNLTEILCEDARGEPRVNLLHELGIHTLYMAFKAGVRVHRNVGTQLAQTNLPEVVKAVLASQGITTLEQYLDAGKERSQELFGQSDGMQHYEYARSLVAAALQSEKTKSYQEQLADLRRQLVLKEKENESMERLMREKFAAMELEVEELKRQRGVDAEDARTKESLSVAKAVKEATQGGAPAVVRRRSRVGAAKGPVDAEPVPVAPSG